MTADTTDWTELREFAGVDLTASFVVSWTMPAASLLIDVDLCLRPEHAFYERPRPAEKACFRPAYIEFPGCTRAAKCGDTASDAGASIDALGIGRIDGFRRTGEGCYEITGTFGTIDIVSERPMVRLKSNYV